MNRESSLSIKSLSRKNILLFLFSGVLMSCATQKAGRSDVPFPVFDAEAHRGGRGLMPENTIPAMLHAVDLGLPTLEMDTHVSADGQVLVAHDDYINPAFSLGPDGREIPATDAKKYALFKMPYSEIRRFDVGSKPYASFPRQKKMKVHMPLLADLIDSVQAHLKRTGKKQVFYNIETKCDEAGDNLLNPVPDVFVSSLMQVIEAKKITRYVVVQSFDKRTLQVLNAKYPQVRTAYLIAGTNTQTLDEHLADLGFNPYIFSPNYTLVTAELVRACHDKGIKIVPWTPNTKEAIAQLKALGVDGIISDYPELLR